MKQVIQADFGELFLFSAEGKLIIIPKLRQKI